MTDVISKVCLDRYPASMSRRGAKQNGVEDSSWNSTHAAQGKPRYSGEEGSPPVSCEAAMDVSSGAASAATTDFAPVLTLAHSRTRLASPDSTPAGSQHSADPAKTTEHHAVSAITVADLRNHEHWASVSEQLEAGLAAVLRSRAVSVTVTSQQVQYGSLSEDAGGLYLRTVAVDRQCALPEALSSWPERLSNADNTEAAALGRMRWLAETPAAQPLGWCWTKGALSLSSNPGSPAEEFASQVLEAVQPLIPPALLPAAEQNAECENWLAYARSSTAATDLRLHGAGPLWVTGFTKSAAGLSPLCLSLPLGAESQAELREHRAEQWPVRHWVIQQDQDALSGTELLLRNWRADASGEPCGPGGAHAWEEVDSGAVLFGPSNALGSTAEVSQEPGQLVALQRQGHCGWASGGVYLSWNVAIGPDWPAHALREGRVRSSAARQAAAAVKNPWLCSELGRKTGSPRPPHVLRVLFAAACSIPQVHPRIVEGLQQHFLPLCEAEFEVQQDDSLAQLNARRGLLEAEDTDLLTCSCCGGEFIFSYVCLIERKGERDGSFCWQCWSQRRRIGLEGAGGPPRNARKCTIVAGTELHRLIAVIDSVRPAKKAKLG